MPTIFLYKSGILMPKVLISDKLSQNAVDIFAAHGVETNVKTGS